MEYTFVTSPCFEALTLPSNEGVHSIPNYKNFLNNDNNDKKGILMSIALHLYMTQTEKLYLIQ